MRNTENHVTLQGRARAPTVRLTANGPVVATVDLEIEDLPRTEITVVGLGLEAAAIAGAEKGSLLRVEGALAFDPETRSLFVQATEVVRLIQRGYDLVPVGPSVAELDRLASVLTPAIP
ncbi:MAG: hypothetical protein KJ062_08305 [Thermoanaerobaculia bacterium]|nr:hypothetical protein [Thermoanaerobaculia bacterium]